MLADLGLPHLNNHHLLGLRHPTSSLQFSLDWSLFKLSLSWWSDATLGGPVMILSNIVCVYLPSGKLTWLWKITIFNGKTHYKLPFSTAMLNYQRVYVYIYTIYTRFLMIYLIYLIDFWWIFHDFQVAKNWSCRATRWCFRSARWRQWSRKWSQPSVSTVWPNKRRGTMRNDTKESGDVSHVMFVFFLNMFWIYLKTSFWVALAIVVQTCFTHNICGICRDFWAQRINKTVCDSTSTTWQWLIHPHNTVLSWNLLTLLSWTRQNPMAAFSPKTFWPPESFFGMPCSPVRRRNWKSFIKLCHTLSTDRPNPSSRKTSEHVPVAAINSNSLFISSWKMVESARSGC